MLTVEEIQSFVNNDINDTTKKHAKTGEKYYNGDHDILKYKLFYYNANGQLVEDSTKSNIRVSHAFFRELVDQLVQYILSSDERFVLSDNYDLQLILDDYFNYNDDFILEMSELLTGVSVKGSEFMHVCTDAKGNIIFKCADSLKLIEVREKDTNDNCKYVIYYYTDRIAKNNKAIKKIQVWTDKEVYFYVQEDNGKVIADDSQDINPVPHILYRKKGDEKLYFSNFGYIPFLRLDNNKTRTSDLKLIKGLIDDYDLMSCGLSNNIQDASEYFVIVKDYQGDNLDELINNIKVKKHIGVDENGAVDFKTVDIPYEARKAKLELDEKNIYRFGFGLNTNGLKDTSASTNIAIKAAYSLLDLKANKLEKRLKHFLRMLVNIVLSHTNAMNKTDYQLKDVYFSFKRNIPTNAQENAQIEYTKEQTKQLAINTILNTAALIDNSTVIKSICDILDIDYEDIRDKINEDEALESIKEAEKALEEGGEGDEGTKGSAAGDTKQREENT